MSLDKIDPASVSIGPPQSRDECVRYAGILTESLRFPTLAERDWLVDYELDEVRLVRVDGKVVGGGALIWMGQFFGGRRVPLVGINAVGVLPEYRGRGLASILMRSIVKELAERGVPLSGLYPATQPVYRSAGYEQAGIYHLYKVPLAELWLRAAATPAPAALEIERITAADLDDIRPVYLRHARSQAGILDRNAWAWRRVLDRPGITVFRVRRGGETEGYLSIRQVSNPGSSAFYDLVCHDLVAVTPDAWRAIFAFLANHRSMARDLHVALPPSAPLLMLARELSVQPHTAIHWMTRILQVEPALMARGYAPALTAEITIRVHDDVLPANSGTFAVAVRGGAAEVVRTDAASADVTLDIRGLAALYTGFATAASLAAIGQAQGSETALARLSDIFAGPLPWLTEIY